MAEGKYTTVVGRRVVGGAGDTPQHGTELVLEMASQLEWRKTFFFLVEGKHNKQDGPKKPKLWFIFWGGKINDKI